MPLVGEGFALSENPPQRIQSVSESDATVSPALLVRARNGKPAPWVLIAGAGPDVRVNGDAMLLGVRVLTDRDEISVAGVGELFFSPKAWRGWKSSPAIRPARLPPSTAHVVDRRSMKGRQPLSARSVEFGITKQKS